MRCEEHVRLLKEYLDSVRAYTAAVEQLQKCVGIPVAEYELAFKLCDRARQLTRQAQRLLEQHIETHAC